MDGTSLDDLDGFGGENDRDLVKDILKMANNAGPGGRPPLPTLSTRNPGGMQNLPPPTSGTIDMGQNPNTHQQYSMDPGPYQAHVIGNSQPTPADFANLMYQGNNSQYGSVTNMPPPMDGRYAQPVSNQQYYNNGPSLQYNGGGGSSWMGSIIKESKIPLFVAILAFMIQLPIFNVLITHSIPSLIAASGGLTTGGLLVKALIAGFLFWIIQRILAPLVTE